MRDWARPLAAVPMICLILRACESIDFCVFRHESNQGLRTRTNVEFRIDSQTLRNALSRASRRMKPPDLANALIPFSIAFVFGCGLLQTESQIAKVNRRTPG